MSELKISIENIKQAETLLSKFLAPTPLHRDEWLSKKYDCDFYLKLENLQPVGSFKIRGATNRISKLSKSELQGGVVAASAGNHAQGVAWGARHFGSCAVIVMPEDAPLTKVQATQSLGAEVVLRGDTYDDAYEHSLEIVKKNKATFIHPFDDADVIAGQGTVGLEILKSLPDVDIVFGALGGGGLMAGVGAAIKALKPDTKIYGCQASGAKALADSIRAGKPLSYTHVDTFADGIKTKIATPRMVTLLKDLLDGVDDVEDDAIAASVLHLMERARVVGEGAGAVSIAVAEKLAGKDKSLLQGKKVVAIVSGGNIDVNLLSRIIEQGLIRTGRRLKLNAYLTDKPGSLLHLARLVAKQRANVLHSIHDRNDVTVGINDTRVELTLETRGRAHSDEIVASLKEALPRIEVLD